MKTNLNSNQITMIIFLCVDRRRWNTLAGSNSFSLSDDSSIPIGGNKFNVHNGSDAICPVVTGLIFMFGIINCGRVTFVSTEFMVLVLILYTWMIGNVEHDHIRDPYDE